MLIECPECHQIHTLTPEQFQSSDGITQCPDCSAEFDPLANLSETEAETPQKPIDTESLPEFAWEKSQRTFPESFWSYGAIAGLCLFGFQVYYFKHSEWLQNTTFRPWLEKTCEVVKCELPIYQNINEISILHSSFIENNQKYTLQTAIQNQSEFPQLYPDLKLTLLNFSGSPIAKRIFQPEHYLIQTNSSQLFNQAETLTVKLDIQTPGVNVGGFTIELN